MPSDRRISTSTMPAKIFQLVALTYGCLGASRASKHDGNAGNMYRCRDLVVAGGGTGGLYSAWRMIEEGLADPHKTCIFEQTLRLGEKVYNEKVYHHFRHERIQETDMFSFSTATSPFSAPLCSRLKISVVALYCSK